MRGRPYFIMSVLLCLCAPKAWAQFDTGACCDQLTGSCTVALQSVCFGAYQGDNTTCEQVDCAGACCQPGGTCTETGPDGCAISGGTFNGLGTTCGGCLCSTPTTLVVPAEYATIQDAIDVSCPGDTILVGPGTYAEMIDYLGKDITVQSTDGPEVTTIDAQGAGSAVTFDNGETADATLDGFTVTGGAAMNGGGILCMNTSGPTLRNLIVNSNTATNLGGGLYVNNFSDPNDPVTTTVIDCAFVGNTCGGFLLDGGGAIALDGEGATLDVRGGTFTGNSCTASGAGGAILANGSDTVLRIANSTVYDNSTSSSGAVGRTSGSTDVTLMNCRIVGNQGAGIFDFSNSGALRLYGCEITGNSGLGIRYNNNDAELINCTISRNQGGIEALADLTLRNSVVWGNTGADLEIGELASAMISYSNVGGSGGSINWNPAYGTDEGGNIDKDPCFVNPDGPDDMAGTLDDDFRLGRFARAVDSGDTAAVPADVLDVDGDMDVNEPLPLDVNGDPRFVDDGAMVDRGTGGAPLVDMGALERQDESVPVKWSVAPGESIQAAIDGACPQDVILVAPGVYAEAIDFHGRDVIVRSDEGPEVTTIDVTGLATTAVTFAADEDAFATLDGFTVTGGSATDGGGILCLNAGPTLRNLIVSGNTATRRGGGLSVENYTPLTTTVADCAFVGNTSTGSTSGDGGGAIGFLGLYSPVLEVRGSTFSGNSASYQGGAIWAGGADPVLRIASSTIQGNSGPTGAGLYLSNTDATLMNCRILGNSGMGLNSANGTVRLAGCEITNNEDRGLFAFTGQLLDVVNCTISNNQGGILYAGLGLELRNSVVWDNTDFELNVSDALISYSNIRGSGGSDDWDAAFGTDEGGNIDADPLFADAEGGDFALGSGSPCIDAASNEGVATDVLDLDGDGDADEPIPFDLDGLARYVDDPGTFDTGTGVPPVVDMGAFEYQLCAGGDLDHNLSVDLSDFSEWAGCITSPGTGYPGEPCRCADVDGDGDVDLRDFAQLQRVFTGAGG